MATIKFDFVSPVALRVANLLMDDIVAIALAVTGEKITWQNKFSAPFKGNFAQWLLKEHGDKEDLIVQMLPEYEAKAAEHIARNAGKQGKPQTTYVQDSNAQQTRPRATPKVEIDTGIANEDIPQVEDVEDVEEDDEDLAKQIAEIIGKRKGKMDEGRVQEIAQAVCDKSNRDVIKIVQQKLEQLGAMPTRVEIVKRDADNKEVVKDLGMQHKLFPELLSWLALRDGYSGYTYPIWLPGPAGSGKTTAAKNAAAALELKFYCNGAVDTEYKLLGFTDAGGTFHETPFYLAYKYGGVYLFDEVDASNPQALVAMNMALENGLCTFGNGEIVTRHVDCLPIAAANTFGAGATAEYVGRNKIDAATIDRFIMLSWDYDEALERAIAGPDTFNWVNDVQALRRGIKDVAKHVISPRASIRGLEMLRSGISRELVMQAVVFKGLSLQQQQQTMRNAGVN